MVCLGNICRSPLAEGIFRHLVDAAGASDDFMVDSAGTGGWHVGNPPHQGSIDIALVRGIDIRDQRSRQVQASELHEWDWIIAMDESNRTNLLSLGAPPERTRLLLSFVPPGYSRGVPDPHTLEALTACLIWWSRAALTSWNSSRIRATDPPTVIERPTWRDHGFRDLRCEPVAPGGGGSTSRT